MKKPELMQIAALHCEMHGLRFTEPRQQVLKVIAAAKKPVGAYDIIRAMPKETKPPTVYRALEFWTGEGFIHHISSLNVYAICHAGHRHQGSQYLICDSCDQVEEAHLCALPAPLQEQANEAGFKLARWNTELHGTCQKCQA